VLQDSEGSIIWLEGIIGAGKTTLARKIAETFDVKLLEEPVEANPYLARFYGDPDRWTYPMQIHLLHARYRMQQAAAGLAGIGQSTILDRGLPGDRVFAKMHVHAGVIDPIEWDTYQMAYDSMTQHLPTPSLLVFLMVDPEVAMERVRERARGCETGIDIDYLKRLRDGYFDLMDEIESGQHRWARGIRVVRWPWNSAHLPVGPLFCEIQKHCQLRSR